MRGCTAPRIYRDVPPRYIDAFLAGLLNYMLYWGGEPEVPSHSCAATAGTPRLLYEWAGSRRRTAEAGPLPPPAG